MAPYLELLFLVIAILAMAVVFIRRSIQRVGGAPRLREIDARFACPRTASNVDCVLLEDTKAGRCSRVKSCSAFGADGAPSCEQHCVELINLGVSLRPTDDNVTPEPSSRAEEERPHEPEIGSA